MSSNAVGTPLALRHNVTHNKMLHATVAIVIVETAEIPRVPASQRSEVEEVGEGFWRIIMKYGFMDEPDVPLALAAIKLPGVDFSTDVSYFLGRETLIPTENPGMALWRERVFVWMSRNAQTATHFFRLPPERVMEVGVQVEL